MSACIALAPSPGRCTDRSSLRTVASRPCPRRSRPTARCARRPGRRGASGSSTRRAAVFARQRLPRHRHQRALHRQRARQGRALPLHRVQGGAPRRHPRPGDGRGDGRSRPRRRGRAGRPSQQLDARSVSRAARRHPPLPRPRLGLPPRVPRPHRRAGRAVPASTARLRAAGRGRHRRAGIDAGELRAVDPQLTAKAWLGMHNYTYLWLKPGGRLSAPRRGRALRRHLHARDHRSLSPESAAGPPAVHLPFTRTSWGHLAGGLPSRRNMNSTLRWEPPTPGPWQQDSAHNPVAQTPLLQHAYPAGFNRGFEEAFERLRGAARPPGDGEHQRVHLPPAAALRPARSGRAQGPGVDRCRDRPPRRRRRPGVRGPHLARGHPALGRGAEAGVDRPPPRPRRGPARRWTTRSCRPTSTSASST